MCVFLLFIFWVGIAPTGYFNLMEATVSALVTDVVQTAGSTASFALFGQ
jgi:hypothetical protein